MLGPNILGGASWTGSNTSIAFPESRHGLADLDRARRTSGAAQIRDHEQDGCRRAAVHLAAEGLEGEAAPAPDAFAFKPWPLQRSRDRPCRTSTNSPAWCPEVRNEHSPANNRRRAGARPGRNPSGAATCLGRPDGSRARPKRGSGGLAPMSTPAWPGGPRARPSPSVPPGRRRRGAYYYAAPGCTQVVNSYGQIVYRCP